MDQHTDHTLNTMQSPAPQSLIPKIDRLILQLRHRIGAYPRLASSIEYLCRLLRLSDWEICFYHVQEKVYDQDTTTPRDANRIQLQRIYFIVKRALFIKTEAAATLTEEIHRDLCVCHRFFQFVASEGTTASGDNSIVVNAPSHVSDQHANERVHVTFKICTQSTEDVRDDSGRSRRWWSKIRGGGVKFVLRSSAAYHLYTDHGYCEGDYFKFNATDNENGWAKKLKHAACRGTLIWDGQKHQFEERTVGGAGTAGTCEMKCANLDAFVEMTEGERYI